jgi:chromosome segregation protein
MNEITLEIKDLELSLFITNINNLNFQWETENKKSEENLKEIKNIEKKIVELSNNKIMLDVEHNSDRRILVEFEEKSKSFHESLNKLKSFQLIVANSLTSTETITGMLEFSMKNMSFNQENYSSKPNEKNGKKSIYFLNELLRQVKECGDILNELYENIKGKVGATYFEEVKIKFEVLNKKFLDIEKIILDDLDSEKQKTENIVDEKTNEFDFKLEEQAKKLDYVRLKVMEITGKINSLSELLDRFFQKSIELESRINSEFLSKRNEFNKKIAFYNSFEEKLNMLNSRKNFLENESYRADLKKEQIKEKVRDLTIKIFDDYNLSLDFILKNYNPSEKSEDSEKRLRFLKGELQSFKDVNPNAHLEYEKIKERFDFLNNQKSDLVESKKNLESIIGDLNNEIRQYFNEKFQEINENFKFYFKILFPTGEGELIVRESENDNEDEMGIDIKADTGSNKSVSLQLLSGGEKALVSIAFLFAIFMSNSSPFYIFDEIDAALDDANLDRFITLVKEFSKNRQIIIISHQKKTMEISDIIYGFSMQSNGITKIVSEKLNTINV